jgi:hypothetical protein
MKTKAFDRVFIIMLENELEAVVRQNAYMQGLEARGARLSDYHGVTHPSQPNYVASIAGLPMVTDDGDHDLTGTTLVDLLAAKGVSWKAYLEDLPDDKSISVSADGLYYRKHNPFISFDGIRNDPERLARVVNARELDADLQSGRVPQYAWYTPNIQNDGHSPPGVPPGQYTQDVDFLARWLEGFLTPLLASPAFMKGTLVVITFDESVPYADNHVYTTLLGDMVAAGTVVPDRFDHYSLLRTVEENFDLGTLGRNDLVAPWFEFLWGRAPAPFDWARHANARPA